MFARVAKLAVITAFVGALALSPALAPAPAFAGGGSSAGDNQYLDPLNGSGAPSSSAASAHHSSSSTTSHDPSHTPANTNYVVPLVLVLGAGLIAVVLVVRRQVRRSAT